MDGKVEHGAALADGGASCRRGTRGGGENLGFELQELPHEAEVGRDDAAPLFDELKGLFEFDAVGAHQISQTDGGGTRDPRLAVNENASTFIPYGVCGKRKRSSVKTQKHY